MKYQHSKNSASGIGCIHPRVARRQALQIGSIGLLGMGLNHLTGLRQAVAGRQQSCYS